MRIREVQERVSERIEGTRAVRGWYGESFLCSGERKTENDRK